MLDRTSKNKKRCMLDRTQGTIQAAHLHLEKNRVEPSDHADQILKQKTFTISAKNIAYILILETDTDTY